MGMSSYSSIKWTLPSLSANRVDCGCISRSRAWSSCNALSALAWGRYMWLLILHNTSDIGWRELDRIELSDCDLKSGVLQRYKIGYEMKIRLHNIKYCCVRWIQFKFTRLYFHQYQEGGQIYSMIKYQSLCKASYSHNTAGAVMCVMFRSFAIPVLFSNNNSTYILTILSHHTLFLWITDVHQQGELLF